jgi:hypothetical protein
LVSTLLKHFNFPDANANKINSEKMTELVDMVKSIKVSVETMALKATYLSKGSVSVLKSSELCEKLPLKDMAAGTALDKATEAAKAKNCLVKIIEEN